MIVAERDTLYANTEHANTEPSFLLL